MPTQKSESDRPSDDSNNDSPESPKGASDYEMNVGEGFFTIAIDTLRQELPNFFIFGLNNTSIYSSNILLWEPRYTGLQIRGKWSYLMLAATIRWSLRWYYSDLRFDIHKLTQHRAGSIESVEEIDTEKPSSEVELVLRWSLEGTPKVTFLSPSGTQSRTIYEGVFIYNFDQTGLIRRHVIEHINPAPSQKIFRYKWWPRAVIKPQGLGVGLVPAKGLNLAAEQPPKQEA
ncbi:hypothetical protein K493DRAFT_357924 [Basidiobolus meristosporus CBS 931.73]|uniref:Uncharacterized protein n=1 Tax=Basidiobolus meristosporus CBS 931.73 TaxID=1314790 RepID=A0A1Y1XVS7_9FUNG|nr:hypothetical protein K493DRAFT_357924 [Basidiobolus meristosporus CBS 931.73]|eukprot:ORX89586.1 hypothetical protein K493DRAFT_357924 [Basidiobolus meristosporus CBS 931.73]